MGLQTNRCTPVNFLEYNFIPPYPGILIALTVQVLYSVHLYSYGNILPKGVHYVPAACKIFQVKAVL